MINKLLGRILDTDKAYKVRLKTFYLILHKQEFKFVKFQFHTNQWWKIYNCLKLFLPFFTSSYSTILQESSDNLILPYQGYVR